MSSGPPLLLCINNYLTQECYPTLGRLFLGVQLSVLAVSDWHVVPHYLNACSNSSRDLEWLTPN